MLPHLSFPLKMRPKNYDRGQKAFLPSLRGGRVWGLLIIVLLAGAFLGASPLPQALEGKDLLSGARHRADIGSAKLGTVVLFLSSKCPCSTSHEPSLAELAKRYSPLGFAFVGVHSNSDEPGEAAAAHFREAKLPFPVLSDERAEIADRFGAIKTPHVFVFRPDGKLVFQGGVDDSHEAPRAKVHYLETALSELAQGKEPKLATARTLGCSIKRP